MALDWTNRREWIIKTAGAIGAVGSGGSGDGVCGASVGLVGISLGSAATTPCATLLSSRAHSTQIALCADAVKGHAIIKTAKETRA